MPAVHQLPSSDALAAVAQLLQSPQCQEVSYNLALAFFRIFLCQLPHFTCPPVADDAPEHSAVR